MARVGIYGSAVEDDPVLVAAAEQMGRELARRGATIITGACSGVPYAAARAAAAEGAQVWGYAPTTDLDSQRRFVPDDDLSIYDHLIYVPLSFPFADDLAVSKKYRNVVSTAHCEAGVIISGKWGTLHEVCSLIDFGRPIGVLTGTGGIADEVVALAQKITPEALDRIIASDDPAEIADRLTGRQADGRQADGQTG